jgi:ubiquitin conjugation factor E4 B
MAGNPQEALVRHRLRQLQAEVDRLQGTRLAIDTLLGDEVFAGEVTALYRLLAAWLLRLVCPGGVPTLPLPAEVPMEWATLPEWFLEDMAEWLLLLTRAHPNLLQGQRLDELMLFFVVFIGSPAYVRSPYLRSKLTEVMHAWLPQQEQGGGFGRR